MSGKRSASPARTIRAPRGTDLSCKGWHQEAAMRMLMNNLDPDVAENSDQLIVYGGAGRGAGGGGGFVTIRRFPPPLKKKESLLLQSSKTHGKNLNHAHEPPRLFQHY